MNDTGDRRFYSFTSTFYHRKEHGSDTFTENQNLIVFVAGNSRYKNMKCQALSKCYSTPETENKYDVFRSPFRLTSDRGLLFLTGSTDESEFPLSGL